MTAAKEKAEGKLQALREQQDDEKFQATVDAENAAFKAATTARSELVDEIQAKDEAIRTVESNFQLLRGRIANVKQKIESRRAKKDELERQIAAIAEKNARDTSAEESKRAEQRAKLVEQQSALQAELESLQSQLSDAHGKDVGLRLQLSQLQEEFTRAQQDRNQAQSRLRQLEEQANKEGVSQAAAASGGARRFTPLLGLRTPQVWQQINAERGWRVQPIGPLGEYVQLNKLGEQRQAGVSECLTRREMSTFVVDNTHDQHKLSAILKRVYAGERGIPRVLILPRRERYPVVKPRVPFPLVLDCIEVKEDWAFNGQP